jgi:hypothetical protein
MTLWYVNEKIYSPVGGAALEVALFMVINEV